MGSGLSEPEAFSLIPSLSPRRESRGVRVVCWLLGLALVAGYVGYYGWLMCQNAAVPFMDQANYVCKVYAIQDAWATRAWYEVLNPGLYLSAEPRQRGPLMALPAALLGRGVTPAAMAFLWLGIRMGALVLAAGLWARLLGTVRSVPALLAVILGSEFFLHVQPYQYMMDHMFASFGLLAFVALLWAIERPGPGTAAGAAAATLALVLIKPQGIVFVGPAYGVMAVRGWMWWRALRRTGDRAQLKRWRWTAVAWVVLAAMLVALRSSSYGRAVAEQYQQGSQGWWAGGRLNGEMMFAYAAISLSPWLVVGLVMMSGVHAWQRRRVAGVSVCMALAGGLSVVWWLAFNTVWAYTLDPRIIAAGMPLGAAMVLAVVCRSGRMAILVTAVAVGLGFANVGVALGWWPHTAVKWTEPWANPRVFFPEPRTHEVGLIPLARRLRQTIATPVRGPEDKPVNVTICINDEYVEGAAVNLALRSLDASPRPGLVVDSAPWGSTRFHLRGLLTRHWFLTKDRNKAIALQGDAWTSLYALDALITDAASPLHGRFERRFDAPLYPQSGPEETVTLWYLADPPGETEVRAALRFVEPRFQGTAGQESIMQQIDGKE